MPLSAFADALTITYSSGLILTKNELATLAVYYDKIYMPYPFNWDPNAKKIFEPIGDQPALNRLLGWVREDYMGWKGANQLLFAEGVLEVLPPPDVSDETREDFNGAISILTDSREGVISSLAVAGGVAALAAHFLSPQKHGQIVLTQPGPEIVEADPPLGSACRMYVNQWASAKPSAVSRPQSQGELIRALVESLCHFDGLVVPTLLPERILEIRRKIAPYKKGFTNYLVDISGEVQELVDSEIELKDAAAIVAEKHIVRNTVKFLDQYESALKTALYALIPDIGGVFRATLVFLTYPLLKSMGLNNVSAGVAAAFLGLEPVAKAAGSAVKAVRDRRKALSDSSSQAYMYVGTLSTSLDEANNRIQYPDPPDLLGLAKGTIP